MRLVGCSPCLAQPAEVDGDAVTANDGCCTGKGRAKDATTAAGATGTSPNSKSKAPRQRSRTSSSTSAGGVTSSSGGWCTGVFGLSPWARLVDSISSKLAFYPPEPASYEVKQDTVDGKPYLHPNKRFFVLGVTDEAERAELDKSSSPRCRSFNYEVVRLQTKRGCTAVSEIVGVWLPHGTGEGPVLLFSHGNAVDLGIMMPFYRELVELLGVNVFSYDYSGYGESSGSPTVSNTLLDIAAAFDCLRTRFGKAPQEIVLYGQSVGSGPSVHLAARTPDLGGLVLHSPLLSGVRVLHPEWKTWPAWADIYPNHRLMPQVKCPVLVMHGTEDEVVDFSHGQQLAKLAPNASLPLWAEGYNHQNLERSPHYLPALRDFLSKLKAANKPKAV